MADLNDPLSYYQKLAHSFTEQLKERLQDKLISVVLYGSTARGEIGPESDIDILIIADKIPSEYHQRINLIFPILKDIYRLPEFIQLRRKNYSAIIEYLILDPKEAKQTSPLDFDLSTDAQILFDKGFFVQKMSKLKQKMSKLGARKVIINNKIWYWDLKPDIGIGEVIEI